MGRLLLFIMILIFMACKNSEPPLRNKTRNNLHSFFIDLPEYALDCPHLKLNFKQYQIDLLQKNERGEIFDTQLNFTDSIAYKDHLIQLFMGDEVPSIIDLRLLDSKKEIYSYNKIFYGWLWTESTFLIFQYKNGSLVECTKEVMPSITLSDFIKPSYLNQFFQDFINNPYLIYTYQNDRNDTLKVEFEPQDHPFFENPNSESAIKKEDILLVWKKNRFVKIDI